MKKFRLGILSYIIILCILAFVIVKIRDTRLVSSLNAVESPNNLELIAKEEWNQLFKTTSKIKNENSIVIYNPDEENSLCTYKNVKYVLETMGVNVVGVKLTEQKKYTSLSDFSTMVVCIDSLSDLEYTSSKLQNWVKNGKGIFFTLPLLNDEKLKEFSNLLGIQDKNNIGIVDYENMTFTDDFLIGAKDKVFGKLSINGTGLKVDLKDDVTIHATTAEERGEPIIWNVSYGNGHVSVCNANMLQDKVCRGIIAAAYSELHVGYVYPVINSSMYCIDDFPSPIPVGYNELIYEQYACNMEDFYFNIWWPKMKLLTKKYGIKYEGYLIQTYENIVEGPFNNKIYMEASKYYANELLNSGGEMGLHGYNHQSLALTGFDYRDEEIDYVSWKSIEDIFEATRSAIAYGKELAPNAEITSYVAPSNIISTYVQSEMEKNIEDIKVYAGVYIGNESQMVQEFEAKDDGIVYVPRTDSGMDISIDAQSDFLMYNELTYHYVHSNFFHPDDVLDEERGATQGFETLYNKFEELIKTLNSTGIRNTTVTEGGAAVQRYQLTSCKQTYEDGNITLEISGIHDTVYYMICLNDNKKIKNVVGAEYKKINDKYYLLEITQKDVVIEME